MNKRFSTFAWEGESGINFVTDQVDARHRDTAFIRRERKSLAGVNPRCPSCNSIIYSRRHKLCGVCNQLLPAAFLFDDFEARNIEETIECEKKKHRAWLRKASPESWQSAAFV